MTTLNFAAIAMMIGSSLLPMNAGNIDIPASHTPSKVEVVDISIANREMALPMPELAPAVPVKEKEIYSNINQDKAYEQCMKEAFERIYEEVNKLLDQIPDQTDEQFQLQRMM